MFHPMKPETIARRRIERAQEIAARKVELRQRLAEKVANDPEGESGIWAEMLRESA
jgi:hypothetical protein